LISYSVEALVRFPFRSGSVTAISGAEGLSDAEKEEERDHECGVAV
jgi:hypothetical protein